MAQIWAFKWFSPEEMRCKCGCGRADMDHGFMGKLDSVRGLCGFPLPIASGFRCHGHDLALGGSGTGAHPQGMGSDIAVHGPQARILVKHAMVEGITSIGIMQHGPTEKQFIHLDDCGARFNPYRQMMWSY